MQFSEKNGNKGYFCNMTGLLVCESFMEDYILREIDKIGKVIESILVKIGVMKKSAAEESVRTFAKTELLDKIGVNLDVFIGG